MIGAIIIRQSDAVEMGEADPHAGDPHLHRFPVHISKDLTHTNCQEQLERGMDGFFQQKPSALEKKDEMLVAMSSQCLKHFVLTCLTNTEISIFFYIDVFQMKK
jgi:hypothetical protein